MKRIILMILMSAGVLSCARENLVPAEGNTEASDAPVSFHIDVAETKAEKSVWADGDVIYVFFKGMESKYLKLTCTGAGWSNSPGAADFVPGDFSALSEETLTAVHFPVAVDVSYAGGKFSFTSGGVPVYNYYLFETGKSYTVDASATPVTVTASLSLGKPADMIQIHVDGIQASARNYTFGCPLIRPVACASVNAAGGAINEDMLQPGARLSGFADSDGAIFAGRLVSPGVEADYKFTLAGDIQIYTLSRPGRTLTAGKMYNFPALSDANWTVTAASDLYVDLGLSVKWARYNVGAAAETNYGDYFAWGELRPKSSYNSDWSNYLWGKGPAFTKYTGSDYNVLQKEDDAAYAALGGKFRMPTLAEIKELLATKRNTTDYTWTWCDGVSEKYQGSGVRGWKIKKNVGGATIFLPAAGYRLGGSLNLDGSYVNYWSSSLDADDTNNAWGLLLTSGGVGTYDYHRYLGFTVRPVHGSGIKVTKVELDEATLELDFRGSGKLTATVSPANASNRAVVWTSSNPYVAEVAPDGTVTGKEPGKATITVTTSDGGHTATCEVTVKSNHNGYEYVDLGLPSGLKWAACNVGASSPEEYGDYFAWGEGTAKTDYAWATYTTHSKGTDSSLTKYCQVAGYAYNGQTDALTTLEAADDAATKLWGGIWRMPTREEIGELLATRSDTQNYKWTWCDGSAEQYNNTTAVGWKIERLSSPEATLFLPAGGHRSGSISYYGPFGGYWSSSLGTDKPSRAWVMSFRSDYALTGIDQRCIGRTVRPVFGRGIKVTKVELNKATLELPCGTSGKLTATVSPANASNRAVVWTSGDPAVAEVAPDGTVTGKEPGKATITVTTTDGGKTATCEVTVKPDYNGYKYVDLGLPSGLKWATMNVGATSPEKPGYYFAWGETTTKTNYTWGTYTLANGTYNSLTKYCNMSSHGDGGYTDGLTTLEKDDDAARASWGGSWRMPTKEDFQELRNHCNSTWTIQDGKGGYKFTCKTDDAKSIFLPAAGYRIGARFIDDGSSGYYWSSSLDTNNPSDAWYLFFYVSGVNNANYCYDRYSGLSVRAVSK